MPIGRAAAIVVLPLISLACSSESGPSGDLQPPDSSVVAAFTAHVGQRLPVLDSLLADTRCRRDEEFGVDSHVGHQDAEDREAQLWRGSVGIGLECRDLAVDMSLPEFLSLEFVAHDDSTDWVLLVEDGYLYDLMPESEGVQSEPPFEVIEAAKTAFKPTVEFVNWVRDRREALAADSESALR